MRSLQTSPAPSLHSVQQSGHNLLRGLRCRVITPSGERRIFCAVDSQPWGGAAFISGRHTTEIPVEHSTTGRIQCSRSRSRPGSHPFSALVSVGVMQRILRYSLACSSIKRFHVASCLRSIWEREFYHNRFLSALLVAPKSNSAGFRASTERNVRPRGVLQQ